RPSRTAGSSPCAARRPPCGGWSSWREVIRSSASDPRAGRVGSLARMSHLVPPEPSVSIDALETFVELISQVEADPPSDAVCSRLCEATCRLAARDRAIIFRSDGARGRVRAAGAYGLPLEVFADAQVTVETVPLARESLVQDRVIEISSALAEGVPPEYANLI